MKNPKLESNPLIEVDDPIDFITSNLDVSISVEASAGCGKTYALIARVCELLRSGRTTIDRLLLLTFTENSAADMKIRLIAKLQESEEDPWAKKALENLHLASIQTIHSFAFDICSQFHDMLGLPDDISILNTNDQTQMLNSFFDEKYDTWGNDANMFLFFKICKLLKISRISQKNIFKELLKKITYIPGDHPASVQPMDIEEIEDNLKRNGVALKRDAKKLFDLISNSSLEELTDGQLVRVQKFQSLVDAIVDSKNDMDLFEVAQRTEDFIGNSKYAITIKKSFSTNYRNIESEIVELGESITSYIRETNDTILRFIVKSLLNLAIEYRELTFSSGQITFDDSIIAARRAIELSSVREQLWSRFDSIIVDEFQDTDIHQLAILDSLSDEQSSGDLARLFVVGDDKQSIYGFRGATVQGYKEFVRTRPLTRIPLTTSRRTVPQVIEAVNRISSKLIEDYLPLQGVRSNIDEEHQYHVKIVGSEIESNVDDIREMQGHDCVEVLAEMYDKSLVYDKDTDQIRKCKYSDMTILIRDKNSLSSVVSALDEYSLPFSIDSSSLVWELTMVRSILALTLASANPRNSFAVIAALKTPAFQVTNDELYRFAAWSKGLELKTKAKSRSIWDYRNAEYSNTNSFDFEGNEKIINALNSLRAFHDSLQFLSPSHFLARMLFNSPFFQSFVSVYGESHAISVTKFLISDALLFEESHQSSDTNEYVKYLESNRDQVSKSDTQLEPSTNDVIRVMTIHASKGLEFPIVAFIPSHSTARDRNVYIEKFSDENNLESINFALSISSKLYDSRLVDHKDSLKDIFLEEEARLSYVAMTRAQDHLIVAAHHKQVKSANNQASQVGFATRELEKYHPVEIINSKTLESSASDKRESKAKEIEMIGSKNNEEFERKRENRTALRSKLFETKSVNATSMKVSDLEDQKNIVHKNSFLDISSAAKIGKAVHRALNIIDFESDQFAIEAISTRCSSNEGLSNHHDIKKCISMVSCALKSPLFKSAGVEIFRELPISGYIENVFCEGYIDCLIKNGDQYTIVDYKTDTIDNTRTIESKLLKHSQQMAFYSLLLKNSLNISKCDAVLFFLDNEKNPYIEVENLENYENIILESLKNRTATAAANG